MKTKQFLFAATALTVMTACSSDYDFSENNDEERVPVKLAYTTVAAETRAAQDLNEGTFDDGDQLSVFISQTGADSWTQYSYQAAADGSLNANGTAACYSNDYGIDIVARYPEFTGTTFSIQADQRADADYKRSDLMFATLTNQARTIKVRTLTFTHKMAKICVNVTKAPSISEIISVKLLNVKPQATVTMAGEVTLDTSCEPIDVTMSNGGAAAIPAQSFNGNFLAVTTDKGTATYRIDNKTFEAGKKYAINVIVAESAINATTLAVAPTVVNVTSDYVGWLIANDGYVYQNKSATEAAGKTPVAMICYIGEPGTADISGGYRGLAIALKDAGIENPDNPSEIIYQNIRYCANTGEICIGFCNSGIIETTALLQHAGKNGHTAEAAQAAFNNNGTPVPPCTSGWFLPSAGQWELLSSLLYDGNQYNYNRLNSMFEAAGLGTGTGDPKLADYKNYTTSTPRPPYLDGIFYLHISADAPVHTGTKLYGYCGVRSFLAF